MNVSSITGNSLNISEQQIDKLINNNNRKELYKKLSTEACGSFYITIKQNNRKKEIITSPGYQGGYFDEQTGEYSNTLGNILSERNNIDINHIGLASFLGYGGGTLRNSPVTTPFSGIRQISCGQVFEINSSKITKQRSYLNHCRSQSCTFNDGIEHAIKPINGDSITVLFSGGKDSTALYLAIKRLHPNKKINVVTMDRYPELSLEKAKRVSNSLDFDLHIVQHPYYWDTSKDYISHIINKMGERIVEAPNPYQGLPEKLSGDSIVAGHEVDAMLTIDMPKSPQRSLSNKIVSSKYPLPAAAIGYPINYILCNLLPRVHYTKEFANNKAFRKVYVSCIPKLLDKIPLEDISKGKLSGGPVSDLGQKKDIRYDQDALLMALLTNSLPPQTSPAQGIDVTDVQKELEKLQECWNHWDINTAQEMSLIKFYQSAQNANLRSGCPNMHGDKLSLPTVWGPLLPLFLRPPNISDIISPKQAVRDYIKEASGKSYDQLLQSETYTHSTSGKSHWGVDKIIDRVYEEIKPESSQISCLISNDKMQELITSIQNNYNKEFTSWENSKYDQYKTLSLINLELLLSRNGF